MVSTMTTMTTMTTTIIMITISSQHHWSHPSSTTSHQHLRPKSLELVPGRSSSWGVMGDGELMVNNNEDGEQWFITDG